jgi:hypothetical protein
MKIYLHIALLSVQLLMCFGVWRPATAQPSNTSAIEPGLTLTSEQVVNKLVERNRERAQALVAYQGTRIYRLEHHGFPRSRSAEMTVAVEYRSPGTKEFSIRSETGSHLLIEKVFHKLLQSEKRKRAFTKKISLTQYANRRFLAILETTVSFTLPFWT